MFEGEDEKTALFSLWLGAGSCTNDKSELENFSTFDSEKVGGWIFNKMMYSSGHHFARISIRLLALLG